MAKIATLVDTFATLDTSKWAFAPNASIVSGRLQLLASATYQGARTLVAYDLVDSFAGLEVAKTAGDVGGGGTVDTAFTLELDASNNVSFTREGSQLYLSRTVAGTWTQVGGALTYDAAAHRWWRFRHDTADTLVKWQASPDGVNWTTLQSWAPTFAITALKVYLEAGYYAGNTAGDLTALFDNLNSAAPTRVVDRWSGTALVRQRTDRWNGTALVQQTTGT